MADSFDLLKNIGSSNFKDEDLTSEENQEAEPSKEVPIAKEAVLETAPNVEKTAREEAPTAEVKEKEKEIISLRDFNIFDPRGKLGKKGYALTVVPLFAVSFAIKFIANKVLHNDVLYYAVDIPFLAFDIIATIKRLRDIDWTLFLAFACILPVQFALGFNIVLMFIPSNLKKDNS